MKAVWLAFGLIASSIVIVTFHDVLLVFFAAAIFAVPLRAGAVALGRALRAPIAVGLVGVIVASIAVVAAILSLWELLIAAEVRQLLVVLPGAAETVVRIAAREPWASRIAATVPDPGVLLTGAGGLVGALRGFAGGTVAALVDGAILVFATVCFAAEPRTYVGGMLRLVIPSKRARIDETLNEAAGTIALWLRARVISMVTVGVLVGVGLRLAGIPDAAALAVLAAIFAFVPNVGAIAAALPSLLLAVPFGWQRVLVVVALYWLAHVLDDFIVIPIAERRVVSLPPALTIAAQLVLGLAGGVLGIMMAAPFVAVATVLLRRLVVEDVVEARHRAL
ncbi:MAG TPA: AI-2E family transporter [Candidatus Elarobacter sp.]|nr:AI-2E family transporter [Candidatus Elarobacter sp.]